MMERSRMTGIIAAAAGFALALGVSAQETGTGDTTTAKPMSSKLAPVSQSMLDAAGSNANNWIHSNGSYAQTRYYPGAQINAEQRRQAAAGVRVPDRGARVDGDGADRGRRRHVPHDLVQPRVRDRRGDRQGVLALQAQDGADHDLLLRPEQPRRRDRRRHAVTWARSTPSCVALDAKTGKLLWETQIADPEKGYSETMAPDGRRRQGADRHQRRRVRHPRLRQGVRRRTTASCCGPSTPSPRRATKACGPTKDATGRNMHRDIAAEKAALRQGRRRSTRRSAAACG